MGFTHSLVVKTDTYKDLRKAMDEMNGARVKVGFPEDGAVGYPTKAGSSQLPAERKDMSEIAQIAAWNEFGVSSRNIPPRPFFRDTVDGKREEINQFILKVEDLVLIGKKTVDEGLELIGLKVQALMRQVIRSGSFEPNKPATIRAKHSSKPLVDTAQMLNSITFVKEVA